MLLFKPIHKQLILSGVKTQTRRIWKKPRCRPGSIHKAKTKLFSKDYFVELYIVNVHTENLLDISEKDAYAEGGYTIDEFLKIWDKINPKNPSYTNPMVYVVDFYQTQRSIKRNNKRNFDWRL